MKVGDALIPLALLIQVNPAQGASPGDAPPLPIAGTRVVHVSTEAQLQSAMGDLHHGDTLLLADGIYNLTSTLYINGRNTVTIRGAAGSTNVVLVGKGMDNSNYGDVPFGIWSNGTNTTIAHLIIRDTWDNEIIFNAGAQSPRVYCVRLLDAGSQFIKSNPTDVNAGLGVNNGIVEYCWFEYTGSPPGNHGSGAGYFNGISAHCRGGDRAECGGRHSDFSRRKLRPGARQRSGREHLDFDCGQSSRVGCSDFDHGYQRGSRIQGILSGGIIAMTERGASVGGRDGSSRAGGFVI
jgi:hypothetical protein